MGAQWVETTNPIDPLTTNGEWSLRLPFLEGYNREHCATYTVRLEPILPPIGWIADFWHGNRGYTVACGLRDIEVAKRACYEHFHLLRKSFVEFQFPAAP